MDKPLGAGITATRTLCALMALTSCFLLLPGCNRAEPLKWDVSSQTAELSEKLQDQVTKVLNQNTGTAREPALMTWSPVGKPGVNVTSDQQTSDIARQKFEFSRHLKHGQAVYLKRCVQCHGVNGDGNGPAAEYLYPKPRDYTKGIFKFTSTPYGSKPRREDLIRTLRKGITGTSMPAFNLLPEEDIEAVVDYITVLSQRGELELQLYYLASDLDETEDLVTDSYFEPAADESDEEEEDYRYDVDDTIATIIGRWEDAEENETQPLTPLPLLTDERVARGREAFLTKGCSKCHGEDGRGHTPDNIGKDTWGNATRAADLTSGMLHGGQRPIDVYRRILNGINGTPMPGFSSALASEPETIWDLVSYVLEVSGRRRDILIGRRTDITLIPAGLMKPYEEPQQDVEEPAAP